MQLDVTNLCEDCPDGCDHGRVESEIVYNTHSTLDMPRSYVERRIIINCEYIDVCKFKGTDSYMEDE